MYMEAMTRSVEVGRLPRENLVRCERFAVTFFEDQLGASSGMFVISMISS